LTSIEMIQKTAQKPSPLFLLLVLHPIEKRDRDHK
jgi:hypothetical protein